MTTAGRLRANSIFCGLLIVLSGWLLVSPTQTKAQTQSQGNNAVYNGSSNVVGSSAFIDASAFVSGTPDICAVLYNIISPSSYPPTGAVIDARGINPANALTDGSGNLICAGTPWSFNGTTTPHPATIILPYTQIAIHQTWVLPNGSRITGKAPGVNIGVASLQAVLGFPALTPMIEMGTACPATGCTGVTVEHLTLDANKQPIDAIDNSSSQEQSYVDDVVLKYVGLTGLKISAPNSGPYSNIRYGAYQCSANGCPVCVDIEAQTKGLHGISCIGNTIDVDQPSHAAILVNASNNSVEDVHVEGFWDGVEVGNIPSTESPVSNVTLINITGASGVKNGSLQNTIHICGSHANLVGQCSFTTGTTKDVTILQAFGGRAQQSSPPFEGVLLDDVTGTTISSPANNVPTSVGIYVLGEPMPNSSTTQYSRFSTNPNTTLAGTVVPTWGVGATGLASTTSCTTPGGLYSNTTGIGNSVNTIYVCTKLSGMLIWQAID
jgi:hypothetical protein